MASDKKSSPRLGYLFVFAVLIIALLVCIGVIIWLGTSRSQSNQTFSTLSQNATTEETIKYLRKRFPGFFLTPDEQQYLIANESKTVVVTKAAKVTTFNCNMPNCSYTPYGPYQEGHARTRRATSVYHGCCETFAVYVSPLVLPNLQNPPTIRNLPQFPGQAQQVFKTESCSHVSGCTGCTCIQDSTYFAAVYEKVPGTYSDSSEKYDIDWFQLPGCCRCRNV